MSGFAPINQNLSYWQKQAKPLFPDLAWNVPEQKTSTLTIVGGNLQSFSNVIRTAEYAGRTFPLKHIATILPDVLRKKLPSLENVNFAPSTSSGSFAKSYPIEEYCASGDMILLAGDLSHNAETAIAITDAIQKSEKPFIITRDTIDLIASASSQILSHQNMFIIGSMSQIQKIFRAVYYPRMVMLSQPLLPVIETLHKFTLSYPVTILTFHQENIIVASNGNITTTHIHDTDYTPISLWSGQLAIKVAALNLYNPNEPFKATTAAILYK